jgi:hypothetical protein
MFDPMKRHSRQTFEETSGYVRPEQVNKWPNSMTDMMMKMKFNFLERCGN